MTASRTGIANICDSSDKALSDSMNKPAGCEEIMRRKCYWTYIMASRRNGTLYVGVTGNLARRVWQHREGIIPGFTRKYGVKMLVYFEVFDDIRVAIHREKRLKFYRRRWKIHLIESVNPAWRDLYETITVCW